MKCALDTCAERVQQPYIRIATGERGGPGDYREDFFCTWTCAVEWIQGAQNAPAKTDGVLLELPDVDRHPLLGVRLLHRHLGRSVPLHE